MMKKITWDETLINTKYFDDFEMFDLPDAFLTPTFIENRINTILSVCIDELRYLTEKQEEQIYEKTCLGIEDEDLSYLYERTLKLLLNVILTNQRFVEKYCDKKGWDSKNTKKLENLKRLLAEYDYFV